MDKEGFAEGFKEKLEDSPEAELGDSDYLDRYMDESGDLAADELGLHGLNRVLFALDALSGESEKPVYVHVIIGIAEMALAVAETESE